MARIRRMTMMRRNAGPSFCGAGITEAALDRLDARGMELNGIRTVEQWECIDEYQRPSPQQRGSEANSRHVAGVAKRNLPIRISVICRTGAHLALQ